MKTEELNSRIKELNDYFISQIIEGNYQVIKEQMLNNIFKFSSYMIIYSFGYDVENLVVTELRMEQPNFMKLQFDDKKIKSRVRHYLMAETLEIREEEIKRLEAKLKTLKSTKE